VPYRDLMETVAKILLGSGLVLLVAGAVFLLLARLGVHRLPGDLVVRRGNLTVYAPIGFMVVVSVLLTIALNVFLRR
jgi:multisubunit Na+/H+ antiporter MnhG subunit